MKFTFNMTANETNKIVDTAVSTNLITADKAKKFYDCNTAEDRRMTSDGLDASCSVSKQKDIDFSIEIKDTLVCNIIDTIAPAIVGLKSVAMILEGALKTFKNTITSNVKHFVDGVEVKKTPKTKKVEITRERIFRKGDEIYIVTCSFLNHSYILGTYGSKEDAEKAIANDRLEAAYRFYSQLKNGPVMSYIEFIEDYRVMVPEYDICTEYIR